MMVPARALASLLLLSGVALRIPALGAPPQDAEEREVRSLIEQLDSEDLTQRDRARQDLTAKGRKIVPLLKPYLKSSSAEVASQVRSIVERLDREERLERSLPPLRTVTLAQGRHTPAEVLDQIRQQTGYRIDAYGLKMREPLEVGWDRAPVLRVLDELCRRMGQGSAESPPLMARTIDEFGMGRGRSPEAASDQLSINGDAKPPFATAHWNQFRSAVTNVTVTEERSLKESSTQACLTLSVSAQPGTHPIHVGQWVIEEALDDRGTSLRPQAPARAAFRREPTPEVGESLDSVWFTIDRDMEFEGSEHHTLSITPPAPNARRIARLQLKLKVSFAVEELTRTLKVQDIKEKGTAVADFGLAQITFRQPEHKDNAFHLHYLVSGTSHGQPAVVLLDADGTEIRTRGSGGSSSGADHQRQWYLRGSPEVSAVRVSAWIGRKTIEIPFEFSDIPLPVER